MASCFSAVVAINPSRPGSTFSSMQNMSSIVDQAPDALSSPSPMLRSSCASSHLNNRASRRPSFGFPRSGLNSTYLRISAAMKSDPLKIMISGAPASGKGTQCELIMKKLLSCGFMRRHGDTNSLENEGRDSPFMFGSNEAVGPQVPTQAQSVIEGSGTVVVSEYKPIPDIDYLQELLAIQQQGPRAIGFFGTRNMGFMHQQLIEILSYAMVITKNHIYTSGASGTNAAVIRGALRAEKPELLTVILPQSLKKQPPESQELLAKVKNLIEKPQNDHLPLLEASRLCNKDILSHVQQVICFAFHDSKLLMETCQEAKNLRKIVTLFYLD